MGKSFEAVGGAPANPERHVYVNENVDDGYREFEATHERATVWLHNDVAQDLKTACKRRGDKTRIVNEALRAYLREST